MSHRNVSAAALEAVVVEKGLQFQQTGEDTEAIGTWLCKKGPYQEYIAACSGSNPGLKKPDPKNKDHPLKNGNATVVMLDAPATGSPGFKQKQFRNASELEKHLKSTSPVHGRRRIYIMEGLAPDYIAVMGSQFFMDPTFWMRHERTCVWSNQFTPTSDALPQPSLLEPEKTFQLQFCELRQFERILPNKPFFCHRTGRHIGMTPPRHDEKSTVGILRRKISFWCRETAQEGWDVVIVCDPQLAELWESDKKQFDIRNTAFQDGYIDFLPISSPDGLRNKPQHPHHSMLRDLCHYFEYHADVIAEKDWQSPLNSSIFLKKIVAAHYLQLVDYIKAMLPSLELRLTSGWIDEEDQWRSLQTISRRCGNYSDDMEDILLSLGYALTDPKSADRPNWTDCERDFQYIYYRLKILKHRADTLMQAMTGLASIAGNRQNLDEAKRVKRLNLLALLFIPLAYTSSLFSMSDHFQPGADHFWVYWVTALPAIVVTFAVSYVMNFTLDEAARWTWRPLIFWRKDKEPQRRRERRGTGVWKTKP